MGWFFFCHTVTTNAGKLTRWTSRKRSRGGQARHHEWLFKARPTHIWTVCAIYCYIPLLTLYLLRHGTLTTEYHEVWRDGSAFKELKKKRVLRFSYGTLFGILIWWQDHIAAERNAIENQRKQLKKSRVDVFPLLMLNILFFFSQQKSWGRGWWSWRRAYPTARRDLTNPPTGPKKGNQGICGGFFCQLTPICRRSRI